VRNCAAVQSRPFNIAQALQEALALHQQGRLREAEKLYARALKAAPDNFDALHLLGLIKAQSGQMGEAYRLMSAALKINPDVPDVLINFANVLHALKRDPEALDCLDKAIALRPGDPEAMLYRGNALSALDRPQEAVSCFDAVLARNPGRGEALLNRGTAFARLGRHAQALADFDAILVQAPDNAEALYNRGTALLDLNRFTDAVETFGRLWLGEFPLGQRTILLPAEQGLGDTMQFIRYAPLLARTGATVAVEVQPELKSLLARVDGITSCHARGEPLPACDVFCPLGSLPLALKTERSTVPADIPYLRADDAHIAKWRSSIEHLQGKRVALAWAGHARHPNDRNRSIDLKLFGPLFALEGISFISIQPDLRGGDDELLARHNITQVGDKLADMADTAAIVALADITIAVDTSVAHLAGALGREAWVLLPFSPDWRWTLSGEHSPWYPQVRLLRQSAPGDWPGVVAAVRDALLRISTAQ